LPDEIPVKCPYLNFSLGLSLVNFDTLPNQATSTGVSDLFVVWSVLYQIYTKHPQ